MSNTSEEKMSKISWWRKQVQRICRFICCYSEEPKQDEENVIDISMNPHIVVEAVSASSDTEELSHSEMSPCPSPEPEDLGRKPRIKIMHKLVIREDSEKTCKQD